MSPHTEMLERSEIAAWEDVYRAASAEAKRGLGIELHRVGPVPVLVAAGADVLAFNKAMALGLDGEVTGEQLDEIVSIFERAGTPRFFAQIPPGPNQDAVRAALEGKGLRRYNNWVRLTAAIDRIPEVGGEESVRRIEKAEAQVFGEIVATEFDFPESVAGLMAGAVGRPGWTHYLAEIDGEPAATAGMFVRNDVAWFGFAATRERYRGRGLQKRLIARRLADAAELGCVRVSVETAEPTPEKDAPSHRNLLKLGFEHLYTRPNYILELGP